MAILVTGASGFIGKHVIDILLRENYEIIGVVRSLEKAKKVHSQFCNTPKLSFEIVPELTALDAFDAIFERHSKYIFKVIHIASPFICGATDFENQLLVPAVNGTLGILNSVKRYGKNTVTHVVITSSLLAVTDLSRLGDNTANFTENDWNPATWSNCQSDPFSAYAGSKKFAEEAAWNFMRENKERINFALAVIVPAMAMGPNKFAEDVKDQLNVSNRVVDKLLHSLPDGKLPSDISAPFIDVRDVARAHFVALENDSFKDQRICVFNRNVGSQDILDIMNANFPQLRGKISQGPRPGQGDQKPKCRYDTSFSNRILGFEFVSLEQSVEDTVAQVLSVRRA